MKCKKIKELLLTDYYDNELPEDTVKQLRDHLKICSVCRRLEEEIKTSSLESLKNVIQLEAPQEIWLNIKDGIQQQATGKAGFLSKYKERLESIIQNKKPVLALVPVLATVIIAINLMKPAVPLETNVSDYLDEQISFYASLDNGGSNISNGSIDFGTDIEYFFL